MGTTVLDAGTVPEKDAFVFAHCTKGRANAVTLLADNPGETPLKLTLPSGEAYTLTATSTDSETVMLNGKPLAISPSGDLPPITGKKTSAGELTVAPKTILFYVTSANNTACRTN
jgi:heparanase 1